MVKTKIIELLDLIEKDLELSGWSKGLGLEGHQEELLKEIEELKEAFEKKDMENYKEELGDILWDVLKLILVAEREGILNARETIENIRNKISMRKPHLLEGKKLSAEEESKIWYEIKEKEKNERSNNH